jgi:hypothetical protein
MAQRKVVLTRALRSIGVAYACDRGFALSIDVDGLCL